MREFDINIAAKSNWIALREVLSACALPWSGQVVRDDFDELFLIEGVEGVRWMFEDLGWLSDKAIGNLNIFDAAIASLSKFGGRAYEEDFVEHSIEWAHIREAARDCLESIPEEPWSVG